MNGIIGIYKKLSLPARASIWYMVCSVLQKGVSVLTTPIFTRILTTEQYGTISIYNSWESIITVFATLNFTAGVYNNAMVKYPEDRDGYTSVLQTWTTFITTVLFTIYFLFHSFWNNIFSLSTPLMMMMFVDIIFTAGMSFWTIRNRYEYKYFWVCIITLVVSVLSPIVSIACVFLTDIYKSEARIFGIVIVHVIIYGCIYLLNIRNGKKLWNKKYISYSTKFNIPLIPHYLSQNVLSQADRIMINDMCSVAQAGIYSVAYQAGFLINIVTNSINSSFVPYLYESMSTKRYTSIRKLSIQIELLVGMICFLFSLFAPEFLLILATEEYHEAIWIIPPISMSALFIMLYSFFTNVEFYFEENKFIMFASIIAAALNVVLNFIFINMFGYIAAGYTTLFCYIVYSLAQYIFMCHVCKKNKIDAPYDGKLIWLTALVFVILSGVSEVLYLLPTIRYIVITAIVAVSAIIGCKYRNRILKVLLKK